MASQLGTAYIKIAPDLTGVQGKISRELNSAAGSSGATAGKTFGNSFSTQASQSFNNVANGIAGLAKVVGGFLVGGAVGMGAFIKQASDLQSIRASFQSMTGSADEARKVLQQLNEFSFKTAFSTQAINDAARTFLGAGLEVKNLGSVMSNVGDIAGATGADLGRLTLPLSQAMARGKLQTQDFYQILDSGAGKLGQVLREEVAKRGMGDFMKAMEEGKVSSELLFDVVEKSAQKGGFAFEGALKQSKTFDGQMSNLMETIGNVGLKILGVDKATGEIDPNGIFAKLSKSVQDATEWLNKNQDTIKDVAMILIDNAVPAISGLAAAFVVAKVAAIGFAIAAGANPIGLIITAISALIAALVFLQVKFNIFGVAWEWIKSVWGGAVAFFTGIWNGIVAIFSGAAGWFGSIFNGATAAIRGAWNSITSWFGGVWNGIKNVFSGTIGWFGSIFNGATAAIRGAWNSITSWFGGVWNGIKNVFNSVGSWFKTNVVDSIVNAFNGIKDRIWKFFSGIWSGIGNSLKSIINSILHLPLKVPEIKAGGKTIIGGQTIIPALAKGGVVTGPTLAMIGEGRESEAVLPLSKLNAMLGNNGKGGTMISQTNNFYNADEPNMKKINSDLAWRLARI